MVIAVLLTIPALQAAARWPLVHDAAFIRYINFLISNGFAPYRDIVDLQMPGTYLTDWLVVHTLGSGSFAWFAWDMLNGVVLTLSAMWIAGRNRMIPGFLAGVLMHLAHLSNGPSFLGQRDYTVAMLLMVSVGCLFSLFRTGRSPWAGCAFLVAGLAATIKPPALLLPLALLIPIVRVSHRSMKWTMRVVLWASAGLLPPFLLILAYLLRTHSLASFVETLHGLVPYYASLHRLALIELLHNASRLVVFSLVAVTLYIWRRSWRDFEINLLMLSTVCGAILYLVQGKGFHYHLYPALSFVILWIAVEWGTPTERTANQSAAVRHLSEMALVAVVALFGFHCLKAVRSAMYPMNTLNQLESDLNQLGGSTLSHHVQCLDMTWAGCVNVLYRMRLIQSTGNIADFYLFPVRPTPVTTQLQNEFLAEVTNAPPRVIVLSSHMWPSDRNSYDGLSNFPRFRDLLLSQYTLSKEYVPQPGDLAGYRLYVRK